MPILQNLNYQPALIFRNGHFATIYAGRIKPTKHPNYLTEYLELNDGDFLKIDYFINENKEKVLILCHGLEGDSRRAYNNTCANYFIKKGFSIFAWNNRSCGGEINRLPKLYHHAAIEDLQEVIEYVSDKGFQEIYILGFSMGGAQILNYLAKEKVNSKIKSCVAVSTPVQLKSSAIKLRKGFNRVYLNVFIRKIKRKLRAKANQFPGLLNEHMIEKIKSFDEVDEFFTAPLHGFKDREDYYKKASPGYSIHKIKTPVLIINSEDDPFLGKDSYPADLARKSNTIFLEVTRYGGHCGFPLWGKDYTWADQRAYEFFSSEMISDGSAAENTALPATKTSAPN